MRAGSGRATAHARANPINDHIKAIGDRMRLGWWTVKATGDHFYPMRDHLNLIFRTVKAIEHRKKVIARVATASRARPLHPPDPAAGRASLRGAAQDAAVAARIVADFAACGVVGEETNKRMGYIAAVSRKLEQPLAIVVQSSSAAGKSALMEAVLALMPEEERVQYSAMTGQSLFYMGETDLKHKILAIAEEEGAERASYALKLLQSEGKLTIASTGKDPHTGKLVTHEYHVEGPVMIFLTTTAIEIDEELLNRCIVLTVDEDREQTRAIHRLQRESQTLEGLLARRDADRIRALHRIEYIEVTRSDIDLANRLAHEVLGRSLDELPPQTRRLLTLIDGMVTSECERLSIDRSEYHFTRRHAREVTRWGETQLRIHLDRLVALEYLLVHRGGRGQSFVYELLYNPAADQRPSVLDATTTQPSRGEESEFAGGMRGQSGTVAATARPTARGRKASADAASHEIAAQAAENAHLERVPKTKSYRLRRGNGRDRAAGSI